MRTGFMFFALLVAACGSSGTAASADSSADAASDVVDARADSASADSVVAMDSALAVDVASADGMKSEDRPAYPTCRGNSRPAVSCGGPAVTMWRDGYPCAQCIDVGTVPGEVSDCLVGTGATDPQYKIAICVKDCAKECKYR